MKKFLSLIALSLTLTGCAELGTAINAALDVIPSSPAVQNNGDDVDMMSDEFAKIYNNQSKEWCHYPADCKKKKLGFDHYIYFEGYLTNPYSRESVGHVGNNVARAAWKAEICREAQLKTGWKAGCAFSGLVNNVELLEQKRYNRYGAQYNKIFTKDI